MSKAPAHAAHAAAPAESRKISPLLKLYGIYCLVTAAAVIALIALITVPLVQYGAELFRERHDVTLTMTLTILQVVTMFVGAAGYVAFGVLMLRDRRRHVAQIAYGLVGVGIVNLLLEIMLNGFGDNLTYSGVRLLILIVISATIDPTLITERQLQRKLRDMETEEAAEAGTLGRAKGDRGFIELDFFNLFWVFVVCCVLGLIIETVYHMVVVDPGVYQDRAGMLYGPFSPIYGFGAVLMTVALNRFYKANPVVIFLVPLSSGGSSRRRSPGSCRWALAPWPGTTRAPRSSGSSRTPSPCSLAGARPRSSCACGARWALCGSRSACRGCSS